LVLLLLENLWETKAAAEQSMAKTTKKGYKTPTVSRAPFLQEHREYGHAPTPGKLPELHRPSHTHSQTLPPLTPGMGSLQIAFATERGTRALCRSLRKLKDDTSTAQHGNTLPKTLTEAVKGQA